MTNVLDAQTHELLLMVEVTAMQRQPSSLISKVHFSPAGSAVTGLHWIGSMDAGSVHF